MALSAFLLPIAAQAADWLTFAHDPQRTGWAAEEPAFSVKTVPSLTLLWKTKVGNDFYSLSALTAPVVAEKVSTVRGVKTVAYVVGISGKVFALGGRNGERALDLPN